MTEFARRATEAVQRKQSRRGFLATLGKVVLGLGTAMVGAGSLVRRVSAAQCCVGYPVCGSGGTPPCPGTPGCPPACTGGSPNVCCDKGQVGSTGTLHRCYVCDCGLLCQCEFDLGSPC